MLRAHSVFLKGMRNWLFFLLKCNAFQAGFHGWLGGGKERERERLSRSYYRASLSQANLHINHRRPAYKQRNCSSRTPETKTCSSPAIIFIIWLRAFYTASPKDLSLPPAKKKKNRINEDMWSAKVNNVDWVVTNISPCDIYHRHVKLIWFPSLNNQNK